jgi:short-subunit dehydrogenase
MARRGARLILVARDSARLAAVARELARLPAEAHVHVADLADPNAVEALADDVSARHGTPDVLVNNAGAGRWLTVEETSAVELEQMTAVPYFAAFNLTRAFLPGMRRRGTGHIVNVTSVASRLVWPGAAAYTATRWAILAFSESLRAELAGTGLRVTVAIFGTVATPYWTHNPGSEDRLPLADRSIPRLTAEAAAEALCRGVARERANVILPRRFRLLFFLNAVAPKSTARMLRRGWNDA